MRVIKIILLVLLIVVAVNMMAMVKTFRFNTIAIINQINAVSGSLLPPGLLINNGNVNGLILSKSYSQIYSGESSTLVALNELIVKPVTVSVSPGEVIVLKLPFAC